MNSKRKDFEKKIEEYRSKANIDRIKAYQENQEKYLADESEFHEYAGLIERDIIKPYLKQKEEIAKPYKKGIVAKGILAGVFVFAAVATHLIAKAVGSTLPTTVISAISGAFSGAGGYWIYSAVCDKILMNKKKKEEKFVKEEWDFLKEQPAYIKEFMYRNDISIENNNSVEKYAKRPNLFRKLESPLDDEILF